MLEILGNKERDVPVNIFLDWQTVHAPISPPPDADQFTECADIEFSRRKVYCQKMQYLDRSMAAIVNKMKSMGMWDNTYMFVTTDNGAMPNGAFPGNYTDGAGLNIPLRGGKANPYEGGVRGVGFLTGGLVPKKL